MEQTKKLSSYSFRYGGTGTEIKIYFETPEELEKKILDLSKRASTIWNNVNKIKDEMREKNV